MGKLVRWISISLVVAWAPAGCAWFPNRAQSTPIASPPDTPTVTSVATRTSVPSPTVTLAPTPAEPDDAVLLTWQREGGIAGFCDGLTVRSSGKALVTSCRGETAQERRLSEAEVAQVSAWAQKLKPFDHLQSDDAVTDGMVIRLSFLGQGRQDISEADLRAMLDFTATAHR
jgi:hypothetical protein